MNRFNLEKIGLYHFLSLNMGGGKKKTNSLRLGPKHKARSFQIRNNSRNESLG